MAITSTKLVDDNFKIMVNANGVGTEEDQKIVDVEASNNASSEPKVSIANLQYEILEQVMLLCSLKKSKY